MEGSVAAEERAEAAGQTGGEGGGERPPGVEETARRDPDAPRTVTDSIAHAREALEQGKSLDDLAKTGDAAEEALGDALEAEAGDGEPPEGEEPPEPEAEAEEELERPELAIDQEDMLPAEAVPEGWSYDDNNRLHRKDGSFASLQEHEDLRSQFEAGREEARSELEEEEGGEEETPDEGEPEGLTIELPARDEGETFEIEASDEETAERLRQLRNGYQRGEEHKRQMEALQRDRREFEQLTNEFEADPAAFLVNEKIRPEIRKQVVLRLLGQDEVWDEVQDTIRTWEINPDKKRADLAELENESYERRDEVSRDQEVRDLARQGARQAREHMETLLEDSGLEGRAAEKVMRNGMKEIGGAMLDARRFNITLDEAKRVLEQTGTLDLLGLAANGSGGRSSSRSGSSEETPSKGRVRAVDPDSEEARKARRAGKELESRAESRRAAAASPQGAGASAVSQVKPPEGQGVEERIEFVRKKGLGALLSGQ